MDILRIKNKYAAVALFLMLSVALQAQDYGALKYMLQKRPANERFESNKFKNTLFLCRAGTLRFADERRTGWHGRQPMLL